MSEAPCPRCGKPSEPASFPFCSRRCRLIDLGEWLGGRRGIPVVEDGDAARGDDEQRDRGPGED